MEKLVFRLLTLRCDNETKIASELTKGDVVDNGSAFFISDDGKFLTAGHVVNLEKNTYKLCAVIGNDLVDVEILHTEYESQKEQNRPFWQDFAFGKIKNKQDDVNYIDISYTQSVISEGKQLNYSGYSSALILQNKEPKDINDLTNNIEELSNIPYFKKIAFYHLKGTLKDTFEKKHYNNYTNIFSLSYTDSLQIEPRGMSGGPIIDSDGSLLGIFINGSTKEGIGISVDYIYETLIEQKHLIYEKTIKPHRHI